MVPSAEQAQHYADRLMQSQKLGKGSVYLHNQAPPTRGQVAAVLHALADHTFLMHLLSDEVFAMGEHRANLGEQWQRSTGIGRFLQNMGNDLEEALPPPNYPEMPCEDCEQGLSTCCLPPGQQDPC